MAFSFMDASGALGKVLTVLSFAKANMPSNAPQGASIQIKYGLGNASSVGMVCSTDSRCDQDSVRLTDTGRSR